METFAKPVVKLQRIRHVIQCPGCDKLFYIEDECAAHLLKSCIRFSSNNHYESRRNLAAWIVDYFKTYTYDEQRLPESVKIDSLMNDDRISNSLKASLRVHIPELSTSLQCPICGKFSHSARACFEHLFSQCLYATNGRADFSQVRAWLSEYFSAKTPASLAVLKDVLSNYSAARFLCKYCKTEAADQQSLNRHFPCPRRRQAPINATSGYLMCELCNLSLADAERLTAHLIAKHYRCPACGLWPKNGRTDYAAFRQHMRECHGAYFRCPMCVAEVQVRSEQELRGHVAHCKRERAEAAFHNRALYCKCDVISCADQVLLCDMDAHVQKHLRNGDNPSGRQKRVRLSVDNLNELSCSEVRRNSVCVCNGNPR